ncbi:MAG: polyhydroxybutyrate depolymerase [Bacteroidia bacterium]|jgi:polyhydroxybutyrate depolymerase
MGKRWAWSLVTGFLVVLTALTYGLFYQLPPTLTLPGTIESHTVDWDGHSRAYTFYKPANLDPSPALVFVYHGSGGDAQQSRRMFGYAFEALAEEEGFIVVYPVGFENHYNGCRKAGPYAANQLQIDDVGFMRQLVDLFAQEYAVDRSAVFATGVSNGGQMALRLALEAPDLVAAVAPVATSLPTPANMDCEASGVPVAFLLMNGTDDPMNPYEGGTVALYGLLGDRGEVISSPDAVQYWARLAGHVGEPSTRQLPDRDADDDSTVVVSAWEAVGKKPVVLYTIVGGGHNAPHPQLRLPRLLGGTNNDIVAAQEIWQFFVGSRASLSK